MAKKGKARKTKCSTCKQDGHNKATCSYQSESETLEKELDKVNREHALDSEIAYLKNRIHLNSLKMDEDLLLFSEIGAMLKAVGVSTIDISINLNDE